MKPAALLRMTGYQNVATFVMHRKHMAVCWCEKRILTGFVGDKY